MKTTKHLMALGLVLGSMIAAILKCSKISPKKYSDHYFRNISDARM